MTEENNTLKENTLKEFDEAVKVLRESLEQSMSVKKTDKMILGLKLHITKACDNEMKHYPFDLILESANCG